MIPHWRAWNFPIFLNLFDLKPIKSLSFNTDILMEPSLCVQQNKPSKVSGEEGLKDMRVVDAIYSSIASGRREKIV